MSRVAWQSKVLEKVWLEVCAKVHKKSLVCPYDKWWHPNLSTGSLSLDPTINVTLQLGQQQSLPSALAGHISQRHTQNKILKEHVDASVSETIPPTIQNIYSLDCILLKSVKSLSHVWRFCDPIHCSLPGSSIHGIFQAKILEWVAISFSRRFFQTRDWTQVSHIVGRCFTI